MQIMQNKNKKNQASNCIIPDHIILNWPLPVNKSKSNLEPNVLLVVIKHNTSLLTSNDNNYRVSWSGDREMLPWF